MKLLSLKRVLYTVIVLVGFTNTVGIGTTTQCSAAPVASAYKKLEDILYTCIFDQTNKKPLSYFVYEVTNLVNGDSKELGKYIPVQVLEQLVIDLHKVLQISRSAPQPETTAVKVGFIFKKYHKYLPLKLKQKTIPQFLAGLRFRLGQA